MKVFVSAVYNILELMSIMIPILNKSTNCSSSLLIESNHNLMTWATYDSHIDDFHGTYWVV